MTTIAVGSGAADRVAETADATAPSQFGARVAPSTPEAILPVGATSMRLLEFGLAIAALVTALLLGFAR